MQGARAPRIRPRSAREPSLARRLAAAARAERGSSLVEGLLALSLVLLVFALGAEALLYMQARTIATAAAQAGARAAALGGEDAGLAAARQVLAAGGGVARRLDPSLREQGTTVTATVTGPAQAPFSLAVLLPLINASASVTLERYPASEAAVGG